MITLFAQSIGMKFRLKGSVLSMSLADEVAGVDEALYQVKEKAYGSFHVSICELIP